MEICMFFARSTILFSLICLLLVASRIDAQPETLVGVWRSGNDPVALHRFNSWEAFVNKWKELGPQNQRLVDIEVLKIGGITQYTGAWRSGKDNYALHQLPSWETFVDMWQKLAKQNLRLVDIEVVKTGSQLSYIGVWREGNDGHALQQLNSWEAFVDKWKELAAKKLHLVNIEAIPVGNNVTYIGAWRAGLEGHLFYAQTYADFTAKWKELAKQNQRLVDVELLRKGFAIHYIGVWHEGQDGYALYQADGWEDFVNKWKEFNSQSLRLTDVAVAEVPGKPIPEPKGKPLSLVFDGKLMKKDPVSGLEFPTDMPAINYPEFVGCREEDKKVVREAWAKGHFSVWRAYQFIEYIAAHHDKDELWRWGYKEIDGQLSWSPRAWFGSFEDSRLRFQMIHEVVSKLWNDRFLGKKYNFKVKCREQDKDGPHPCYIKDDDGKFKYSANHILLGTINFCPLFFQLSERDQVQTVVHEVLHWLSAQGLYVTDTHTHSDIVKGLCRTKTEKIYGWRDAMELAQSDGCLGSTAIHRQIAARSNDNYAFFIERLGYKILKHELTSFPGAEYFKTH
jgi:polyglycine hydrolase-like protein